MSEWISVEDRLPTPDTKVNKKRFTKVLTFSPWRGHQVALYYEEDGFVDVDLRQGEGEEMRQKYKRLHEEWANSVSHWQHLIFPDGR